MHPIGRLDKDTTGVLILTSDGDLTQRLAHPKFNVKKTYQVTLQKSITMDDFLQIKNGLHLEDGFVKPDKITITPKSENKVINVEIHNGKKHIVKRLFRTLCYNVKRLDRTCFAGITKKGLSRGAWRFLKKEEVERLKSS